MQSREDLESILHNKADTDRMQELIRELKDEVLSQLKVTKKEMKKKEVKKKTEVSDKHDVEFERINEEFRAYKDKLTKLANTFDRELVERDK